MIKPIITDKKILAEPSAPVYVDGHPGLPGIVKDLLDTAEYHRVSGRVGCIGLAANQIGYLVRVVVVWRGAWVVMFNPKIKPRTERKAKAEEGCLSRPGVRRKIERYKRIAVTYLDGEGLTQTDRLNGIDARVVQHEVDHLDGVFI